MPTYAQRAQGIADALVNGTATQAQIARLGAAIASMTGQSAHYAGLTNAQKAEFIVRYFREVSLGWVRSADVQAAMQAASSTADTDFPEAP